IDGCQDCPRVTALQSSPTDKPVGSISRSPASCCRLSTTTVTLVNDDQVKKVFGIFLIKARPMFIFGNGLINREVHFPAFVNLAVFNFPTRISESCKHLVLRVIDQDVSVGKVKNLGPPVFSRPIPTHTPELPADLERHRGLPGAGGHCKQDPLITL